MATCRWRRAGVGPRALRPAALRLLRRLLRRSARPGAAPGGGGAGAGGSEPRLRCCASGCVSLLGGTAQRWWVFLVVSLQDQPKRAHSTENKNTPFNGFLFFQPMFSSPSVPMPALRLWPGRRRRAWARRCTRPWRCCWAAAPWRWAPRARSSRRCRPRWQAGRRGRRGRERGSSEQLGAGQKVYGLVRPNGIFGKWETRTNTCSVVVVEF